MNKKGFTLVEVLTVIVLLGMIIGIAVPGVMRANKKAKEKTLLTKVKNIEKAAIIYGQDNRNNFTTKCNPDGEERDCIIILVDTLINGTIDNEYKSYISADTTDKKITNPLDESKYLNNCEIQIYKKYGKIYAFYTKSATNPDSNTQCWKDNNYE